MLMFPFVMAASPAWFGVWFGLPHLLGSGERGRPCQCTPPQPGRRGLVPEDSIPADRAVLALRLPGEIRGTRIKITDVAGCINLVRLLPKATESLWLRVFGLRHHLGVKTPSIRSPGTCEGCFLFLPMIFHAHNPSGGEEMRLPGPVAGTGVATQGSRFPFNSLVCCLHFPICKLRLFVFVLQALSWKRKGMRVERGVGARPAHLVLPVCQAGRSSPRLF